jgi:hypothetical protein
MERSRFMCGAHLRSHFGEERFSIVLVKDY